jgi:hypothetical protein
MFDRLAVLVGAAAVVTVIALGDQLYAGDWAIALFWIAAVAVAVNIRRNGRWAWRGVLILALAAMSALSWGVTAPTSMAGTLALTTVVVLADGAPAMAWPQWIRPGRLGVTAGIGALAFVVAAVGVNTWRARTPYQDQPKALLTADLGTVAPALAGTRSTPATLTYLMQMRDCVRRHPAAEVSVLQDNAFAYPAFGLHNPFPMDWPIPLELDANSSARMLAVIDTLNRDGDYLVLFQTVPSSDLAAGKPVPATVAPNAPIVALTPIPTTIRDGLHGRRITCGSFVGVWSPRTR